MSYPGSVGLGIRFRWPTPALMDLRAAHHGYYVHVLNARPGKRGIEKEGTGLNGLSRGVARKKSCPTGKEADEQPIFDRCEGTLAVGSGAICPFLAGSPGCGGANKQKNSKAAGRIPLPVTQRLRELGEDLLSGGRT